MNTRQAKQKAESVSVDSDFFTVYKAVARAVDSGQKSVTDIFPKGRHGDAFSNVAFFASEGFDVLSLIKHDGESMVQISWEE